MGVAMIEKEARIVNQLGLHARPAAQVVKLASGFKAEVEIVKDGMAVNGKSIMGVMMLAAESGSSVTVRANGADEGPAVEALCKLFAAGFGEK
jgi:phosphocarrier protein